MLRAPVPTLFVLTALALSLAGCVSAASGDFPSLAKRPVEDRFAVVQSAPPPAPGPVPADIAGKLDRWRADAAAARAAFDAARGETEAAVAAASGAGVASETWVTAQQALSRLGVTRGPLSDAIADLDALYVARQNADAIDGMPEVAALRAELTAEEARQSAAMAALAARLPG